ncbi:ArsR/SmtB family transcription factor [Paenibacillus mucilaginosus]|uniref:ArsR family transcriptional regulator n=3 Tax=Paenibacillus mucilaginosus TaxID=61624 RepID=I0BH16_9BACL|nr:helix-turn-helix domain-containing protein [Paenibacillus mucilaginosus]AEI40896.1 probable transcriptional regulator [Paenibacillus mucilaginosus KNP414]AFC29485.1 putative transcriptional regulator [Paenibacillus mucilaginosus 3016]AFH61663.1 ArsR family transcriptional regulator [Paenibacillus mucilaginosus K02]MCG7211641.1 helix-turn-helix domain-containing protein [Paenibacillus mucilaginosus]WDM30000.1 helix-turn-helix transcriptional regulator [Paenibacillus mucilaginosus]
MSIPGPNLISAAALIADPSRASILLSLLGGKSLPAGELARSAGVSPQTASAHLAKLVEGGLLVRETQGRHKYFRLAGRDVAHALEALHAIAPPKPVRSLRESDQLRALRQARTCYDHLAGRLGVAVTERLLELGWLEADGSRDFALTELGRERFADLGVHALESGGRRRHFARQCLDWSERRPHLAGSLGAALTARLFELQWIERLPGGRSLRVTAEGTRGLASAFGLSLEPAPGKP